MTIQITQSEKVDSFRKLHFNDDVFVMPNAWDIGSARILERMGFKALATTSSGMAFGFGKIDGTVSPEETFRHCGDIVSATPLPVSADLREGFGDSPKEVYKTIISAAETGVVGGSIEDWTNVPGAPKYEESLAVERVNAGVKHARVFLWILCSRPAAKSWTRNPISTKSLVD